MFPLLLAAALLGLARADTPARCYADQFLGEWELCRSAEAYPKVQDHVACPATAPEGLECVTVTLRERGVATAAGGLSGRWSAIAAQGVEVHVGGLSYFWMSAYEQHNVNATHYKTTSLCDRSQPEMAWAHPAGVRPHEFYCLYATLRAPLTDSVNQDVQEGQVGSGRPRVNRREIFVNGKRRVLIEQEQYVPAADVEGAEGAEPAQGASGEGARPAHGPHGPRRAHGPHGPHGARGARASRRADPADPAPHYNEPFGHNLFVGDELPANFSWRNVDGVSYLPPVLDQGDCGSCYIHGAVEAMMARVMVGSNLTDPLGQTKFLSVQHVLDCSAYSQGCDGGFGEEVSKFSENFGILTTALYVEDPEDVTEEDLEDIPHDHRPFYYEAQRECIADNVDNRMTDLTPEERRRQRYYFTSYGYLGGYLGAVNAPEEIMWEIYRYGPVAVSVYVNDDFQKCMLETTEDLSPKSVDQSDDVSRHYYLKRSNHLVLLVGWGEDEERGKYWEIMNSWGDEWCDGGFIQIRRGTNEYNVESAVNLMYWVPDPDFQDLEPEPEPEPEPDPEPEPEPDDPDDDDDDDADDDSVSLSSGVYATLITLVVLLGGATVALAISTCILALRARRAQGGRRDEPALLNGTDSDEI